MKVTTYINGEKVEPEDLGKVKFTSEVISSAIQAANDRILQSNADNDKIA